ncbi:MAG: hypothetical protein ABR924_10375, partial [Terracidiphilus sp.]
ASIALLLIQLTIFSSIAAKYLYKRWRCPSAWTRTVASYPEQPMRGRYLSVQLIVDGCQSTMPSALEITVPRNAEGVPVGKTFSVNAPQPVQFPATLKVEGSKLVAIRIPEDDSQSRGQTVSAWPGSSCESFRLDQPVDFYIAEHAASPVPVKPGQELWMEVTVPPKGPPRPIQLALKQDGAWKPLAFQ